MYTVVLDNNNYILSIAHTNHDNVELDLSLIDLDFLSCYQLINNVPILDEQKKAHILNEAKEQREAEKRQEFMSNLIEDEKGNLYKTEAINGTNTLVLVEDNSGKLYL